MSYFNISFKGKYSSEDQLAKSPMQCAGTAIGDDHASLSESLWQGLLISLPFLLLMAIYSLSYFYGVLRGLQIEDTFFLRFFLSTMVVVALLVVGEPVHEVIHALCFPRDAVKEIYRWPEKSVWFMYSITPISRRRFVLMSLAPTLVLGVLPFLIFMFSKHALSLFAAFTLALFSFGSCLGGIGDFYNAYTVINKLPSGSVIFSSGLSAYTTDRIRDVPKQSAGLFYCALSLLACGCASVDSFPPAAYLALLMSLSISTFSEGVSYRLLKWADFFLIVLFAFGGFLNAIFVM